MNERAGVHAVTADVVGDESPWVDLTRQNHVPGESDVNARLVVLWRKNWQLSSSGSQSEKLEFFETSSS